MIVVGEIDSAGEVIEFAGTFSKLVSTLHELWETTGESPRFYSKEFAAGPLGMASVAVRPSGGDRWFEIYGEKEARAFLAKVLS